MHIRLGHSPDSDDAFMFYGLATGKLDTGRYKIEHVLADIQSLNQRAQHGELEITALSLHAYAYVKDLYALTRCGGSFGLDYGPMLVGPKIFDIVQLPYKTIAVPGEMTTAFLLLRLIVKQPKYVVVPFDQIIPAVAAGKADVGLIIHEGQLTYAQAGLECVFELGKWWYRNTQLPLPLGVNAIRRDLGSQTSRELSDLLRRSIQYSLDHRSEAVEYALQFGRELDAEQADRFVGMYVNELTVDAGPRGIQGIESLLRAGAQASIIPDALPVEFV